MSKIDGHKMGRRELTNRALGALISLGIISQGINLATDTVSATTEGDATFKNTEPYILNKQNEVTIVSRLNCLNSYYIEDDDTYNHKFEFANVAACRHKDDSSALRYNIKDHGFVTNNNGSDLRWAAFDDPSVTGAVPASGNSDEEMALARDAIEVAADVADVAVDKALTPITIFSDMVAAVTNSATEDPDRFKFEWAYHNGKSDISNQCKFFASHDAGKSPDFTIDSQAAQTYNNFYVVLGETAGAHPGSAEVSVDEDTSEGEGQRPIPRPQNMSKKEKKRYGAKREQTSALDLPKGTSKDSTTWALSNFPVNIINTTD